MVLNKPWTQNIYTVNLLYIQPKLQLQWQGWSDANSGVKEYHIDLYKLDKRDNSTMAQGFVSTHSTVKVAHPSVSNTMIFMPRILFPI